MQLARDCCLPWCAQAGACWLNKHARKFPLRPASLVACCAHLQALAGSEQDAAQALAAPHLAGRLPGAHALAQHLGRLLQLPPNQHLRRRRLGRLRHWLVCAE